MNENATREILWNASAPWNVALLYAFLALTLYVAAVGVYRHLELVLSGRPNPTPLDSWSCRFSHLFGWGLMQRGVVRERGPAITHSLLYIGMAALLFATTMVFIDQDLGIKIYQGPFYLGVTILSDVLGLGVLIGALGFMHRRFIERDGALHSRWGDAAALWVLILLVVQGYALEGLRIHAIGDPWSHYSPVGFLVSKFFWGISVRAATGLHFGIWWFHTLTVYLCIALIPYTKFFHILASSANLFFRSRGRPRGALEPVGDIEQLLESGEDVSFGTRTIKDYSWKQLLDLEACTSCGRCQDNCPAFLSGKPLSPKWLILDSRNHALGLHANDELAPSALPAPMRALDALLTRKILLDGNGVRRGDEGFTASGAYRTSSEPVQTSSLRLAASADARMAGDVMSDDVFWSCTTCYACVEVCPVGINHVDHIMSNRRNMVLMEGELPHEAQGTLRALENRGNPFGPADDRFKWADGLGLPIVKPGDTVDYLYWVGCVSAFDARKQKIARSLVTLMRAAGLSFGVLANAEGCSGDPARRLGEENLFQTLSKKNIETLKSITFKTIVANCPHCFNTMKNEYPQLGNLGDGREVEIIHHSVLLKRLLDEDKLTMKPGSETVTFHDPCYLGRYNGEYDAPRDTLKKISGLKVLEMERSREKGMCCGAGGGHFWMDMKVGERVNVLRSDQAAATGATTVATGCPFCLHMMEDGMKLTGRAETLVVKDIAEVLVEHLLEPATANEAPQDHGH